MAARRLKKWYLVRSRMRPENKELTAESEGL
jgi:hypothetical protein